MIVSIQVRTIISIDMRPFRVKPNAKSWEFLYSKRTISYDCRDMWRIVVLNNYFIVEGKWEAKKSKRKFVIYPEECIPPPDVKVSIHKLRCLNVVRCCYGCKSNFRGGLVK